MELFSPRLKNVLSFWKWNFLASYFSYTLGNGSFWLQDSKVLIFENQNKISDFYDEEIPNVDSNYTCLAVISLETALKKDENYYTLRKK